MCLLYPANELIGAEISVASPELRAQRIEVLNLTQQSETRDCHCSNCRDEENCCLQRGLETVSAFIEAR